VAVVVVVAVLVSAARAAALVPAVLVLVIVPDVLSVRGLRHPGAPSELRDSTSLP
jgi:hypothetical protein